VQQNKYVGPAGTPIEEQSQGWKILSVPARCRTITSGLEGAWTTTPSKWSYNYFENLFTSGLTKSPAGAQQWKPKDGAGAGLVPDAHDPSISQVLC
jgi:catalase-peroxidase